MNQRDAKARFTSEHIYSKRFFRPITTFFGQNANVYKNERGKSAVNYGAGSLRCDNSHLMPLAQ